MAMNHVIVQGEVATSHLAFESYGDEKENTVTSLKEQIAEELGAFLLKENVIEFDIISDGKEIRVIGKLSVLIKGEVNDSHDDLPR